MATLGGDSRTKLWAMIEERARPGADRAAVDRRIWDLFGEAWAVMFTDLAGFSRQVEAFGIVHFLQIIREKHRLLAPVVAAHDGLLLKREADDFLAIFRDPARALACAVAMQHTTSRYNALRAPEDQLQLCVGLGHGRVLRVGDHDVFGQEVNAASKLGEDRARAGEILVTDALWRGAGEPAGFSAEPLAEPVAGSAVNWRISYPPAS